MIEKRFSADSIVRSLLDSHNFLKDSENYDTSYKKELLRFGVDVVRPRTIEKFIWRASNQYVVQTNSLEISKHKWIKKGAVVAVKAYQQHLFYIARRQPRTEPKKELRRYGQYKLVKNNKNNWFLTR